MAMSEDMRKHMIKHNVMGLVNGGIELSEAIDMAWDLNEPLFSERLKMKRKNIIGSGAGGGRGGRGGHRIGPAGGITGG